MGLASSDFEYFMEVLRRLKADGVHPRRAERAVDQLVHGLDGESPVARYGPIDELAVAVGDALSTEQRWRWRVVLAISVLAFGLAITALMAFDRPTGQPIGGTPSGEIGGGYRYFLVLVAGAFSVAGMRLGWPSGGGLLLGYRALPYDRRRGYLHPRVGRVRSETEPSASIIGIAGGGGLVFWGGYLLLGRFTELPDSTTVVVAATVAWTIFVLSLVTAVVSLVAWARQQRIPISGSAGYLLRDPWNKLALRK